MALRGLNFQLNHKLRIYSPLKLKPKKFTKFLLDSGQKYIVVVEITNQHKRMEVMIPEINIKPILMGKEDTNKINIITRFKPLHPDEESRKDGYWQAYIIKSKEKRRVEIGNDEDFISDNNSCLSKNSFPIKYILLILDIEPSLK